MNNDPHKETYRLVTFTVAGTNFLLATNRFDLTTFQVITLYAYRWQVELVFRFLKRTMNGLHLYKQNQKGIQIQFYLLLITALLQLNLKQKCVSQVEKEQETNSKENEKSEKDQKTDNKESGESTPNGSSENTNKIEEKAVSAYDFLKTVGAKLNKYWKIGCHWLKILQNRIASPFDTQTIELLGAG